MLEKKQLDGLIPDLILLQSRILNSLFIIIIPFKFSYKKYNWKFSYKNGPSRYITNIEKIGSCEQVCIKVSNENQLYLTDNFIVTHNSTTLLELGKLSTHKSCLYLAFNKTIQLELEEKIKQNNMNHCSALTLHGLGLSMITKVKKAEVNDGKVYNLMYEIINKNKWLYKLKSDTRNELDFLRYALIDCNNISRLYLTSDLDEIEKYGFIMGKVFSYDILTQVEKDKLFQKYRRIFSSDEEVINSPDYNAEYQSINRRKFIVLWNKLYELREESYSGENIVIDFLDMIYLPVIKSVPVPTQYQYMFVDECQDLSYLQQKFIDKLILEGEIEKYSAFGDFRQSIYLFAGAFSKSFDMFRHRENVVELPLDINYRCSTNIIAYANEVYNNLLPFKIEG